jgi:hypothetical protein
VIEGRSALAERIKAFIETSLKGAPSEELLGLMLDVHRWQRAHAPVIAALTEREPTTIAEIPAVPVSVYQQLPVGTCGPDASVVFRTSGTTTGGRGEHRLRTSELYDFGSVAWARRCVDIPARGVAALSDPAVAPDSSLSHMVALLHPECVSWHSRAGLLDRDGLRAAVRAAPGPVMLSTTAFALVELVEDPEPTTLPPGSVLMVTGGFKGRVHDVDADDLLARAAVALRADRVVTEYGMTELSSQLWGLPGHPYRPPPWLVVVAIDPLSGTVLPSGERGQLRFYDLANLDASVGVETMDEGVVNADQTVTLRGRLQGAPARGCSLTVEEAWGR